MNSFVNSRVNYVTKSVVKYVNALVKCLANALAISSHASLLQFIITQGVAIWIYIYIYVYFIRFAILQQPIRGKLSV